jgi:hypothetical protein
MPTLPLLSGMFFTSQSMVSYVSVAWSTGRGILRSAQRPVHHVIAFGAVFAAHILHHADVAAVHDHIDRVVIALQDRPEVRALAWLVSSFAL